MRYVIEFILLFAMFIVMMWIGDYIFTTQLNVTGLGIWPGFLFALAVSYMFFKQELIRLILYLCGVVVAIAALQYLGIDLGLSIDAVSDLSFIQNLRNSITQ